MVGVKLEWKASSQIGHWPLSTFDSLWAVMRLDEEGCQWRVQTNCAARSSIEVKTATRRLNVGCAVLSKEVVINHTNVSRSSSLVQVILRALLEMFSLRGLASL